MLTLSLPRFVGQIGWGKMRNKKMTNKRPQRRTFTDEYRAQVVRLCEQPGKSVGKVALELGLSQSAVGKWVRQARIDAGCGASATLTTSERDELVALRRENRQLRQEREILKRAATFFAKEATS